MTYQEMEQVIRSITYKPRTFINLSRHYACDNVILQVAFVGVPDAENPTSPTQINSQYSMSPRMFEHMERRDFIHLVHSQIVKMEMHEVDEFFKIDDKHFREPHPERLNHDR